LDQGIVCIDLTGAFLLMYYISRVFRSASCFGLATRSKPYCSYMNNGSLRMPNLFKNNSAGKILFFCLLLSICFCSYGYAQTTLKIGVYDNKPIIFVDDDGEVQGLFVDLLEEIANKENWRLEYVVGHFSGVFAQLKGGEIDILPALAYSKEREEIIDYTSETILSNWGEIYVPGNRTLTSLLELEGKKVGVMQGDIHFTALKELTDRFNISCRFIEADEYEIVFEMLQANFVDVGVVNRLYGNRNQHEYSVKQTPVIFNPIEMRFGATKGKNQDILTKIDSYMLSYSADRHSIHYQLINRWLAGDTKKAIPWWVFYLFIAVVGATIFFFGASLIFRRQVLRRTEELSNTNSLLESQILERTKVEANFLESKQRLLMVLDSLESLVYVADFETHEILFLNKYGREKFGDILGKTCWQALQKGQTGPCRFCTNDRLVSDERPAGQIVWEFQNTLNGRWYECHDQAISWVDGRLVRMEIATDITERKQVEEALEKNNVIVRNKLKAILEPEGDIGTLELSDIVDIEMLKSLMENFYQLTGILGAVLDTSGNVLVAVGWQDICTKFHRCNPDTNRNCLESDTILTNDVPVGTFRQYRCKNNMWDMVTPLEVGGKHMGNVFIGQFFYEDETPDVELFREQARKYGFDETEYLATLDRVPRFSREMADAGIKFYSKVTKMISDLSFTSIKVSRMLTERIHLEQQLRQSQKMEAIGTLAGGIAHDFNNMLGAILGYAEMIRDDCPSGSPAIHDIDQVLKASHRAKDLVKQILAFSRQAEDHKIPMHPAAIVIEAITLLRSSLPTTITIKQDIDPGAGVILADPSQIHQIVMNLCTNAFHAMEAEGGTLTISLNKKTLVQDELRAELHLQPGTFVQLSIRDTGEGILPESREKIFDPFYTTKGVGKGTGLGLAMVYGIVKRCGGSIAFDSQLGEGTEFRITLPTLESNALQEYESTESVPYGNEHIFFVDDEKILVELGKTMLERLGYSVTTCGSSLDALEMFQNHPDVFDLLITDQTMPNMTGVDLSRRILQLRPKLPIILCTGYSSIISEEKAKNMGIKGFALKPLVKKDIAGLIRKVLDGEKG